MKKPALIAAGVAMLTLICTAAGVAWTARGWLAGRVIAEVRAELAEVRAKVAELTEANTKLEAASKACNVSAMAQSAAAVAALARREGLSEIMTCPAPEAVTQPKSRGESLNENQDRKMVIYYNDLFSGFGVRSQ